MPIPYRIIFIWVYNVKVTTSFFFYLKLPIDNCIYKRLFYIASDRFDQIETAESIRNDLLSEHKLEISTNWVTGQLPDGHLPE